MRKGKHMLEPGNGSRQSVFQILPTWSAEKQKHNLFDRLSSSIYLGNLHSSFRSSTLTSLPYELLEAILLNLPPKDLLLSQSVCRRFRDLSISSKPIRRALFLEPMHYNGNPENSESLKWNPFLETIVSTFMKNLVIGITRTAEGHVRMIHHGYISLETWEPIRGYWNEKCGTFVVTQDSYLRGRFDEFINPPGSWKQMLFTQPPATLVMERCADHLWKNHMEKVVRHYYKPGGFTVADIYFWGYIQEDHLAQKEHLPWTSPTFWDYMSKSPF